MSNAEILKQVIDGNTAAAYVAYALSEVAAKVVLTAIGGGYSLAGMVIEYC